MTTTDLPLAGKVIYVTGAVRGQGRSHCIRLARAGADIVAIDACGPVTAHNGYPPSQPEDLAETVSLVEGEGRKVLASEVDVRDAAGQQSPSARRPESRPFPAAAITAPANSEWSG
jgi:NAD(P)-dependent dehydrogenase (short-subunit alcohol dehydrogenase family)